MFGSAVSVTASGMGKEQFQDSYFSSLSKSGKVFYAFAMALNGYNAVISYTEAKEMGEKLEELARKKTNGNHIYHGMAADLYHKACSLEIQLRHIFREDVR